MHNPYLFIHHNRVSDIQDSQSRTISFIKKSTIGIPVYLYLLCIIRWKKIDIIEIRDIFVFESKFILSIFVNLNRD
jgi:hypothetical protein